MPNCPECGFPAGNRPICPECGYPLAELQTEKQNEAASVKTQKTDPANYIYECWVIFWKSAGKYATFSGRASRREFWSFMVFYYLMSISTCFIFAIGLLIPMLAVSWRRMHDIGRCGLWSLCPYFGFFFALKKSDHGTNEYGTPFAAKDFLRARSPIFVKSGAVSL